MDKAGRKKVTMFWVLALLLASGLAWPAPSQQPLLREGQHLCLWPSWEECPKAVREKLTVGWKGALAHGMKTGLAGTDWTSSMARTAPTRLAMKAIDVPF